MSFTMAVFLTVTFLANVEAIGEEGMSCKAKCVFVCFSSKNPFCLDKCIERYCHVLVSPEALNCNCACSTECCSKFGKGIIFSVNFFLLTIFYVCSNIYS